MSRVMPFQFRSARTDCASQATGSARRLSDSQRRGSDHAQEPQARSEYRRHRVHRFTGGQNVPFGEGVVFQADPSGKKGPFAPLQIPRMARLHAPELRPYRRVNLDRHPDAGPYNADRNEFYVFTRNAYGSLIAKAVRGPEQWAEFHRAVMHPLAKIDWASEIPDSAEAGFAARPGCAMREGVRVFTQAMPAPQIADLRVIPIPPVWQNDPMAATWIPAAHPLADTVKAQALSRAAEPAAPISAVTVEEVPHTALPEARNARQGIFGGLGSVVRKGAATVTRFMERLSGRLSPVAAH